MWVTSARFAHCLRCANCSRQFCTEDYTQCLTRNKQKIRLASENPTRQQTTLQRTEWLSRDVTSGESKCGPTVDVTKAFDSITHKSIWDALKSCNIDHDYISLLKKIYGDQKASVQTDEESNVFEIRKGTKQGDPLSSLLFNTVLQHSLKDEIQRWQKKKGMGIYLSDHDHDCLTNLRFADDVLLFATSKEQIRKMLCEFKQSNWKSGSQDPSRQDDDSQ